jgi:hypothetical protein
MFILEYKKQNFYKILILKTLIIFLLYKAIQENNNYTNGSNINI